MAKQCGSYIVRGTIDNVCFYEMNGKGYARISNPLSSKRVKTAPEFEGTRRHAALLQQASPIACAVYKTLPKEKRNITHRRRLTGTAIQMLKKGEAVAAVKAQLQADVLIMLAELLINEGQPDVSAVKPTESGAAILPKVSAVKTKKLYKATFRRVKKVAQPRCGLRGTALYKYYVALGVNAFRLPQYPQLVFCRASPPGRRRASAVNRQQPQMAFHTGVIFNGV